MIEYYLSILAVIASINKLSPPSHLTCLPFLLSISLIRSGSALYDIISMVKFDVVPKYFRQRFLLSDFGLVIPTAEEGSV
jgi:hypothetical protein